MEERRCENCWYCYKGMHFECRFDAPKENEGPIYVAPEQWCGKFYPKTLPPPWKAVIINKIVLPLTCFQ